MRKSQAPSVKAGLYKPPPPPKLWQEPEDDSQVVRREAVCDLYSEGDIPAALKNKLKTSFVVPRQDPSKVQSFDPSKSSKTLGGKGVVGIRPPPPRLELLVPVGPQKEAEA